MPGSHSLRSLFGKKSAGSSTCADDATTFQSAEASKAYNPSKNSSHFNDLEGSSQKPYSDCRPSQNRNSNLSQINGREESSKPPDFKPKRSPPDSSNLHHQNAASQNPGQANMSSSLYSDTIHVYCSFRSGTILSSNKSTPLYTFELHTFTTPQIEIFAGPNPTGPPMGTVTFPIPFVFSRTAELTVYQHPIMMQSNGIWSSGHTFVSAVNPALGPLKWHAIGMFDEVLENTQKEALAVFERSPYSVDKWGKLEIMPGVFQTPGVLAAFHDIWL